MKKLQSILLISISCFIASCTNRSAQENETKKIKLGIIAPLTGEGATYGEAMKRGFDLVFENTPNYELIYEDSKLSAKEGTSAINKLISSDKVSVVYGAAASSVTLAMAPIAKNSKTILFSSISTADDIKNSGDYIFRNVPSNSVQGTTAANFLINKLGIKKIAILKENDDYGLSLAESFKNRMRELNIELTQEETYLSTDTDFRTQLLKIKNAEVGGIFIPGNYEESTIILKQISELEINSVVIGGDGSYSPELIKIGGETSENFYCTVMGLNESLQYYSTFKTLFTKKYKIDPNIYDAYAYEAGKIIKEAIEKGGKTSEEIKDYLYKTEFISLTGQLKFDSNGEVTRSFGLVQVKNGEFVNIEN